MPVLVVDTPPVPTVKNVAEEMLVILGDENFHRGSAVDKTNRILHFIKSCKVKMLIFDELQHFIDQGKKRTPYEVSDWLKTIIDKANVSTVLMGLERSEQILRINEQLRRRFSKRINIEPFDIENKKSRINFIGVVKKIDENLDLPYRLDIKDRELISSLFFATNGIIDYMVKLLIGAYEQTCMLERKSIDRECLELAFTENIWIEGVDKWNPFNKKFCWQKLDKPGMPFNQIDGLSTERLSR
ncbi:TniB family NTP-binding protein [Pleionea sp. CnH1-48]|uniref:TniB family NTP-binding protein n=1 Tax=Pleionea sp. CnH1-48 TaxID=2954494 RepID=UPI002097D3C0|nr:TniB family NTP-binding protein [Pleionea sp. CnH1-48]